MRKVTFAATQFACSWDVPTNIFKAKDMVHRAVAQGADVVVLPELFATPYFCQDQAPELFQLAETVDGNKLLAEFAEMAGTDGVVLPISFFEKAGQTHFNSLMMIDATGVEMGVYRKSHIPAGPGYQEKYYFTPGDTGFLVWDTQFGAFGAGICWDQWFPEAARVMALMGAEALLYPTAIGSEPAPAPQIDSQGHWRRVMQGHAAANCMPVVAANRIGRERGGAGELNFYGSSFIADATGAIVAELGREEEGVICATFDLDELATLRASWGLFRDRRPDLYGKLIEH